MCACNILGWVSLADKPCFHARHCSNQCRSLELDGCSLSLCNWEKMAGLILCLTQSSIISFRDGDCCIIISSWTLKRFEDPVSICTEGTAAYCVTLNGKHFQSVFRARFNFHCNCCCGFPLTLCRRRLSY